MQIVKKKKKRLFFIRAPILDPLASSVSIFSSGDSHILLCSGLVPCGQCISSKSFSWKPVEMQTLRPQLDLLYLSDLHAYQSLRSIVLATLNFLKFPKRVMKPLHMLVFPSGKDPLPHMLGNLESYLVFLYNQLVRETSKMVSPVQGGQRRLVNTVYGKKIAGVRLKIKYNTVFY